MTKVALGWGGGGTWDREGEGFIPRKVDTSRQIKSTIYLVVNIQKMVDSTLNIQTSNFLEKFKSETCGTPLFLSGISWQELRSSALQIGHPTRFPREESCVLRALQCWDS